MESGRTDFTIVIALIGIFLSIGIPALDRGEFIVGGLCIGLATVVAGWTLVTIWQARSSRPGTGDGRGRKID